MPLLNGIDELITIIPYVYVLVNIKADEAARNDYIHSRLNTVFAYVF